MPRDIRPIKRRTDTSGPLVFGVNIVLGLFLLLVQTAYAQEVPDYKLPESTLTPIALSTDLQQTVQLPLTYQQALELAVGKSITLAIEEQNAQQSKIAYQNRLADLLPDVTMQYSQSRFLGNIQIFGSQTLNISQTSFRPQLSASYSIYPGGKNIFEIKASKARELAQAQLTEQARQQALNDVAVGYFDLQQAYWRRAIALQSIEEAAIEVKLQEARLKAGVGIRLDVLQAQTNASQQKQALSDAENQISKATQRLKQLLNMDLEVVIIPPALENATLNLLETPLSFNEYVLIAKRHNPSLKAIEQNKLASKADLRTAYANLLPQVDVSAYIGGVGPGLNQLGLSRFAGVEANSRLFENAGFARLNEIRSARSNVKEADLLVTQANRLLEERLANDQADLKTLATQIDLAKEKLGYTQVAYQQALGRLKAGVGTTVDLEKTMTQLTQARSELADAFLNFNKAQIRFIGDLGVVSLETLTEGYHPNGLEKLK